MRKFILMPEIAGTDYKKPDLLFKVFMSLPPEATAFYCTKKYARSNASLIESLDKRKIRVKLDTMDGIDGESIIAVGYRERFKPSGLYKRLQEVGASTIFYMPTTDNLGYCPQKNEYILYTSENHMFFSSITAQYAYNGAGQAEVAITPNGGQGAAIGIWREEDSEPYKNRDRLLLRQELEGKTGFRFKNSLPLLFHAETYHHDPEPYYAGLSALADQANILIKDFHQIEFEAGCDSMYQYPPKDTFFIYSGRPLNSLARFAAEATLAGAFTGFFTTTVLLGARVVPIYTQRVYPWSSYLDINKMTSFTWLMRSPLMAIENRLLDYLTPLSLESPKAILSRVNDEDYWRRYEERLPEIRDYAFGHFSVGEKAFNRARGFIGRILATGTMAEHNAKLGPPPALASVPPSWPL